MISAVVFDIGNVLIEWHPERYFDASIGPDARARLEAEVDLYGMNDRIDRGEDLEAVVAETQTRHPDWAAQIAIWRDDWTALAGPQIDGSVRLLHALKARGIPVFALSNFGAAPFDMARGVWPFLDDFDRRFLSGPLRMAKPDGGIYAVLERETGVPPDALLFTDDRAENIAAAAARGWHTYLFEGPEGLAARLVAEGLLENDGLENGGLGHRGAG